MKISHALTYLVIFLLGVLVAPYIYGYEFSAPVNPLPTPAATPIIAPTYPPLKPDGTLTATGSIVAVRSGDEKGALGRVTVEIKKEGKGRVLIDTNPFVEPDTQYSADTAVKMAENLTGKSLANLDVIISFQIEGTLIGGPSAGAAMATTTVAAIESKKIKPDVVVTGTIEEDGSIGRVGGIFEKANAAFENNATLFLVPEGQSHLVYYERQTQEERIGGFTLIRHYLVPRELNLTEYAKQNWNMTVIEVSTLKEAVRYMVVD